jgi:hypothetical protein
MLRLIVVTAFLSLALAPNLAVANENADAEARFEKRAESFAKTIAKRALRQGRRAIVLGPQVGIAPSYTFDGDAGFRGSFGVSLLYFDIMILPGVATIKSVVTAAATDYFISEVKAAIASGRSLTEDENQSALRNPKWRVVSPLVGTPSMVEAPGASASRSESGLARYTFLQVSRCK